MTDTHVAALEAVIKELENEPRCPHWKANDYVYDKETAWRCDRVGSLQARLDLISDCVKAWRAHFDSRGMGGQTCGNTHPYIPRYHLVELERLIEEEQGKYTYESYLKMQEEIAELRFRIEKMREGNWEEKIR